MVHQIFEGCKARVIIAIFLTLTVSVGLISLIPPPAHACPVERPDCGGTPPTGGQGEFKGGAVFVVGGGKAKVVDNPGSDPVCEGCVWTTIPSCGNDGKEPCLDDDMCDAGAPGPKDGIWVSVFFSKEPDIIMESRGRFCKGEQEQIVGVEDIGQQLSRDWVKHLPEYKAVSQPKGGKTLVGNGFVTIFHSGQPEKLERMTVQRVYGVETELAATAKWHWDFGDGHKDSFDIPGSTYPDKTVGHVYESTGKKTATVRTEWKGRFWFDGHGPWEIPTPATQGPEPVDIEVVESLPVLGGDG